MSKTNPHRSSAKKAKVKNSPIPAATSDQIADLMSGLRAMSEILNTLVAGSATAPAGPLALEAAVEPKGAVTPEAATVAKIDFFNFTLQLTAALEDYSGRKPVMTHHELQGIPVLGLDSVKKAGLKGFLEVRFSAYELSFQPNDIPPLDTVAKLRDKAWSRIPKKHQA